MILVRAWIVALVIATWLLVVIVAAQDDRINRLEDRISVLERAGD